MYVHANHLMKISSSTLFAILIYTRVYQAKIMEFQVSVMCRLCGEQEEIIQHVLVGCSVLVLTCYLNHHNLVAKTLHWHSCTSFGITQLAKGWYCHQPLPVTENAQVKLL